MPPVLRAARSADLPQVFDLIETAFPEAPRALFTGQTLRDSTFRLRYARVAVIDGAIAGYVRIFARRMLVRGAPVAAGGIGSVATRPDARGNGIATALLRDAIAQMRREGMAVSFLFTGIPAFYERLGYRVVRQPEFTIARNDVLARAGAPARIRTAAPGDLPQLASIYNSAITGATGAIARTRQTWADARHWLDERPCLVATDAGGRVVAYVRSRCRTFGHQLLEAECRPGAEGALRPLLAAVAAAPCGCGEVIVAWVPACHPLCTLLRSFPGATETTDVRFPMMLLPLDPAISGVLARAPLYFWNSDRI